MRFLKSLRTVPDQIAGNCRVESMLTRKQYDLLRFIHECLSKDGVPPSYDEMKEAVNLKSKSGIHRLITGLEERGFIRRLPHKARALEVLRLPENMPARNQRTQASRPLSSAMTIRLCIPRRR